MYERGFGVNTSDVIFDVFDKEVVAIHMPTGTYHSLAGTGADVFRMLAEGPATLPDLTAAVAAKYEAAIETIQKDTAGFIEDLLSHSLVTVFESSALPPRVPPSNGAQRHAYASPAIVSYADLQQLFLLDPIHDVSAAGWPNTAPQSADASVEGEAKEEEAAYGVAGEHVIYEKFEDETVVMNLGTGAYFSLYGPAEDILVLAKETASRREFLAALAAKYDAAQPELAAVVDEFLEQLVVAGILCRTAVPAGSAARSLPLQVPTQRLPFSTLSLQIFGENPSPTLEMPQSSPIPAAERRYQPCDSELLWSAAGGEVVLIDRNAGYYYKLNGSASDAFQLLAAGCTVHEAARELGRKYEATERDLTAAVMILALNLTRMKLIECTGEASSPVIPNLIRDGGKTRFVPFDINRYYDLHRLLAPVNLTGVSRSRPSRKPAIRLTTLLEEYFGERAAAAGLTTKRFEVGGEFLEVCTTGNSYLDLDKAWSHLASSNATTAAALKIHVWDCYTPSEDPFLAAVLEKLHTNWCLACGPRGEVLDFHSAETGVLYHPGPDVLSVIDCPTGNAYFLKRTADPLPYWEIGSPFRYILHFWFAARGLQFAHGGAVGDENGGVLIAGKGGAGKSTTTMLCTAAGMRYAGDDYCLVDPNGYLFSLYNTGKLCGPADLERLPAMRGQSRNEDGFERGGEGKGIYFLSEIWPDRMSAGFPLRAILVPSVTKDRDTRLEPCSPGDALLALAPSTVAQLPTAGVGDCERLAALASKLPAWRLLLGSDLEQIPAVVRKVLMDA